MWFTSLAFSPTSGYYCALTFVSNHQQVFDLLLLSGPYFSPLERSIILVLFIHIYYSYSRYLRGQKGEGLHKLNGQVD